MWMLRDFLTGLWFLFKWFSAPSAIFAAVTVYAGPLVAVAVVLAALLAGTVFAAVGMIGCDVRDAKFVAERRKRYRG